MKYSVNNKYRWRSLTGYVKKIIFACICVVALLPSIITSFFQHTKLAEESLDLLVLNLLTVISESKNKPIDPSLTVAMLQLTKLVTHSAFYRSNISVAKSGLPLSRGKGNRGKKIVIDINKPVKKQLLPVDIFSSPSRDYSLHIPLGLSVSKGDYLVVGITYQPIYSLLHDFFALSVILFFTIFIFLFGTLLFVDTNILYFTEKLGTLLESNQSNKSRPNINFGGTYYSSNFDKLMQELEKHEDQLIFTRNTLQTIFDGLQIGVAMLSLEGKIVLANNYLAKFLNTHIKELMGKNYQVLNFSCQDQIEFSELQQLKTISRDIEVVIDGIKRYFVLNTYPLFNSKNDPVAVIVQYHDITDKQLARTTLLKFNDELCRQLDEQKEQLEESHKKYLQSSKLAAIGELAGGIAHEINNPNGIINAGTKYILGRLNFEKDVPSYLLKYLNRITKQSERISEIVSALLTFSRQKINKKEFFQIKNTTKDAISLVHPRLNRLSIKLNLEFIESLPNIKGSSNELSQVFINIFNNAADAMPDGGSINFSTELTSNEANLQYIKISIHNTGENIPDSIMKKIMEPFFTTRPVGKGTGLGLSVSHGIVEDHGGSMSVRNHINGGPIFEILLPCS